MTPKNNKNSYEIYIGYSEIEGYGSCFGLIVD
jgi:hypothetical protein